MVMAKIQPRRDPKISALKTARASRMHRNVTMRYWQRRELARSQTAPRPAEIAAISSRRKFACDGRIGGSTWVTANTHPSGTQISQAAAQRFGFKASNPRMTSHGSKSGQRLGGSQSKVTGGP